MDGDVVSESDASGSEWIYIPPEFTNAEPVVTRQEEGYGGRQRSFRKRTAIQKMPYSLDRIKHKQLLEGFDVSKLDSVFDSVRLPKRRPVQLPMASPKQVIAYDNSSEYSTDLGSASDSEDSASDDEQILFRGKKLNIKTGYRGVLPRVAWERALKQDQQQKSFRHSPRHTVLPNKKGLAKRKLAAPNRGNDDKKLLDDIIVPDEIDLGNENDDSSHNQHQEEEDNALEELDVYYRERYNDEYLDSDSEEYHSLEEVEPLQKVIPVLDRYTSAGIPSEHKIPSPANLFTNGFASEDNRGAIDMMLSKDRPSSSRKIAKRTLRKNATKPKTTKRHRAIIRRSVRKRNKKYSEKRPSFRLYTDIFSYDKREAEEEEKHPISIEESQRKVVGADRKRQNKKAKQHDIYTVLTHNNKLDIYRKVNIFNTILEIQSNHYVQPKNNSRRNSLPDTSSNFADENTEQLVLTLPVMDAIYKDQSFSPPEITKTIFAGTTYTLTRWNKIQNPVTLRQIFDHVVKQGVSNAELVSMCKSVTSYVYQLDVPEIYNVVDDFHKMFRSKVSSMKGKAKQIHFYQIAVCQLIFLEIAKYPSISQDKRTDIESRILDHIISFFKLLAVVYEIVRKEEGVSYLIHSYEILSVIVDHMDNKNQLWERLEKVDFTPQVLHVLVTVFPTTQPRWSLLHVDESYESVATAFTFTNYCIKHLKWHPNQELIIIFNNIFRKRRYEDFETDNIEEYRILDPFTKMATLPQSLFNSYLKLLALTLLNKSILEKIIPISEISVDNPISVLVNRFNLLLTIAISSNVNLEKRFQELIRPLLAARGAYPDKKRKCQFIFDTMKSLLENSLSKGTFFRGKAIYKAYHLLVHGHKDIEEIWSKFVHELLTLQGKYGKFQASVLKALYSCLVLEVQETAISETVVALLKIFWGSIEALDVQWIHNNLFQIIKSNIQNSKDYIDIYCKVGEHLVRQNQLSWWSFFTYTGLESSSPEGIYFNYRVLTFCDHAQFNLIKKALFTVATDMILSSNDPLFSLFFKKLLTRTYAIELYSTGWATEQGLFHIVSRFLHVLKKLEFEDLILKFVTNLQSAYAEKARPKGFFFDVVMLLNTTCISIVKKSHSFNLLRRELGISDAETERSLFKDNFDSCDNLISKVLFLETGLIYACEKENEIKNYIKKLKLLTEAPEHDTPYQFFNELLKCHTPHGNRDIDKFKVTIATFWLDFVNNSLISKFSQISKQEYLGLCQIYKTICLCFNNQWTKCTGQSRFFVQASIKFQLAALEMSSGFWEHNILQRLSREFIHAQEQESSIVDKPTVDSSLSIAIDQILQESLHICMGSYFIGHDEDPTVPSLNEFKKIIDT